MIATSAVAQFKSETFSFKDTVPTFAGRSVCIEKVLADTSYEISLVELKDFELESKNS